MKFENDNAFESFGITRLPPPPANPICEAATPAKWYRPDGGRCPYIANWVTKDGRKLCNIHAKKECEKWSKP